jgi:hypothetical protein
LQEEEKCTVPKLQCPGTDGLFTEGVSKIDSTRMEMNVPYLGHRKQSNLEDQTLALNEISLTAEPQVTYHTTPNRKSAKIIDGYTVGIADPIVLKAANLLRDTIKVIGTR